MDLSLAQLEFAKLLGNIEENTKVPFLSWVVRQFCPKVLDRRDTEKYHVLRTIANDIKSLVPQSAILPTEGIEVPEKEDLGGAPSVHVDAFLYEDDDIDQLVEEGKLSRNICKDCHSQNVVPLNFISHSASIQQIQFIFKYCVGSLQNKIFLDVGSRLGAFLYGAYHHTDCGKIIGVEINKDWCKLQQAVCEKYHMGNTIQIICDDVRNIPEVVQNADVIVLNNVFEYFQAKDEQMRIWNFLRQNTKSQAVLITIPSLEEVFQKLEFGVDIVNWVKRIFITDPLALLEIEEHEELSDIHVYVVI